jgi:hypothetical protein
MEENSEKISKIENKSKLNIEDMENTEEKWEKIG